MGDGSSFWASFLPAAPQNKKRKFNRDRDDNDNRERTPVEEDDPLKDATTLYVGNLLVGRNTIFAYDFGLKLSGLSTRRKNRYMSFLQSESKVLGEPIPLLTYDRCGEIKRLVMGLDRFNKTPCGFCFVEYYNHQDALDCMKYIGGTKLDERIIRTDLDPGFQEGRQYGYVHPL